MDNMKKIFSFIIALSVIMSMFSTLFIGVEAQSFEVVGNNENEDSYPEDWLENDNVYYTVENGEATIMLWKLKGFSAIPSEIDGCPVVAIGDKAFESKHLPKEIILPDSIRKIGEFAFADCYVEDPIMYITKIIIGKNVEEIGEGAFMNIPNATISLAEDNPHYKFVDNSLYTKDMKTLLLHRGSLSYFDFPKTLERIGAGAFAGRRFSTLELVIPDGVTLGEGVFANTDIEVVVLPSDLTEIPPNLFFGCSQLMNVEIPKTVTKIGDRAFASTGMLSKIEIPEGVTCFGEGVFNNSNISTITLPEGLTKIPKETFYNCYSLKNIRIPDTVTEIGERAFDYSSISKITLGENLRSIGSYAFGHSYKLKEITIPDSVTDIDRWAFAHIQEDLVFVCSYKSAAANFALNYDINYKFTDLPSTKTKGLVLNAKTINWEEGKSGYFKPQISPAGAVKKLKWKSSNPNVATVDNNGKLTAVKGGNCIITCETIDGTNFKATCKVNVKKILVSSVKLNVSALTWGIGRSGTFTATVLPKNAHNKALSWSSSNPKVAKISAMGKITAVGVGTATITCRATDGSGKYATCKVTVKNMTAYLKLNASTINWPIGKSGNFKPTVTPTKFASKKLFWTSSNPKVATVSSAGKLTAKAVGTTTITCKATDGSNLKATCKVTVGKGVTSLKLNCATIKWPVGKSASFKATVLPASADKTLKWTSSNTEVAKVDSKGKLTAVGIGTAIITCKAVYSNGLSVSCKVTVGLPVKSIGLDKKDLVWEVGRTGILKTNIQPFDAINKTLEWTSSDPAVASFNTSGKLTAHKEGETLITCKAKDRGIIIETCTLKVSNAIRALALNTNFIQWEVGKSGHFKPYVTPKNAPKESLKWTSENPAVATVDANGKLTAVAPGTATIVCETTDGSNLRRTCEVFVSKAGECVGYTDFYKTYMRDARYEINGNCTYIDENGESKTERVYIRRFREQNAVILSYYEKGLGFEKVFSNEGIRIKLRDLKFSDHITKEEAQLLGLSNLLYSRYNDYQWIVNDEHYDFTNVLCNHTYIKTTTEQVGNFKYTKEHFKTVTGDEIIYRFVYNTTLKDITYIDTESGISYLLEFDDARRLEHEYIYPEEFSDYHYQYNVTEITPYSFEIDFEDEADKKIAILSKLVDFDKLMA